MADTKHLLQKIEAEQARMEVLIQEAYFLKSECKAKMKSEKLFLTHLKHTINNHVAVSLYKIKKVKSEMKN